MLKSNFKHFTIEKRSLLKVLLTKGHSAKDIGILLNMDSTSIIREVSRNRKLLSTAKYPGTKCEDCGNTYNCTKHKACGSMLCKSNCEGCKNNDKCNKYVRFQCNKTNRWPYICDGCEKSKYCPLAQYEYDPDFANEIANNRLTLSRSGADIAKEEYAKQNGVLINCVKTKKQSIHHCLVSNKELFHCSEKTLYRRINNLVYTVKNADLPRKPGLKVRKKIKSKYNYTHSDYLDRKGHLYTDWLIYSKKNNNTNNIQMDFLGKPHKSSKEILVFTLKDIEFSLLYLCENTNQVTMVDLFNKIESEIGIENFRKLFRVILTDRDVTFDNFADLEANPNGEVRCKIFYADPAASYQKPSVENYNGQLRIPFPKHAILNDYTQEELYEITSNMNSRILKHLDDRTPYNLFVEIYGKELADLLHIKEVQPHDVDVNPIHNKR